jgi:hypothetical protein
MKTAPNWGGSIRDEFQPGSREFSSHGIQSVPLTANADPCVSLGGFAAGLAGADLPVFPLLPRTKRPRFKGGFKGATCDALSIDRHWHEYPHDNIGVRPPPGHIVVDIDPRHGGDVRMRNLVATHGRLPKTWVASTGGGGWHYWFAVGEMDVRAHLREGVDIKSGHTGYVVAAPSIHPDGGVYRWLVPPIGDPAPAPSWLCELLKPPVYEPPVVTGNPNGHGLYTLSCLVARIASAPEGMRNVTTFGACRDAAKQGDLGVFEDALAAAAIARGLPPNEVDTIIRSAGRVS